jgi:hypothetical protein
MGRIWILTNSAVTAVLADPTASSVVDTVGNTLYEINKFTDTPHTLTHATHKSMLVVNDYETELTAGSGVYYGLMAELEAGIPSYYSALMYDNEDWSLDATNGYIPQTRTTQQSNAINWYKRAGDLIRCYGYTAVCAPARDLANVLFVPTIGTDAQTLASDIQGAAAPFFDVVHVQAQNDQPTAAQGYALPPTTFENFVSSSIQQIQGTSPLAVVTCGLAVHAADGEGTIDGNGKSFQTTGPFPSGSMQAMQQATAQYAISLGYAGFWMNFNGNNPGGVAAIQALAGV